MQIEILGIVLSDKMELGQPAIMIPKKVAFLDADVIDDGCRRLEATMEGGVIVEMAAQCDGGMVILRLSEQELRQMAKLVRADDIPPAV